MSLRPLCILFFLTILYRPVFSQQPRLVLPMGHSERVVLVRLSPDGKLALTISTDGTAKLWDAVTGQLLKDFKSAGDASIALVTDAWFSPKGKKVIVNYEGVSKRIYDITSGQMTEQILAINGKEYAYIDEAPFTPDGKRIMLTSAETGTLWFLDIETLKPAFGIKKPNSQVVYYSFSNAAQKIVTVFSDNSIMTWNAITGKPAMAARRINGSITSVQFSQDDKHILVNIGMDSMITLDAISGKTIRVTALPGWDAIPETAYAAIKPIPNQPLSIKLYGLNEDFNDPYIAGMIDYWDSLVVSSRGSDKTIYTLDNLIITSSADFICPDGSKLLLLKKDSSVSMINAVTGKQLFIIPGNKEPILFASFSPDGKKFVTASGHNPVRIWDAQTGRLIKSLEGQPSRVFDARFSNDGKKIIVGYGNKTARIWDLASDKPMVALKGRAAALFGADFDSTGNKILIQAIRSKMTIDIESGMLSVTDTTRMAGSDDMMLIDWHSNAQGDGKMIGDSLVFAWMVDIISLENIKTNRSYNFWNEEKEVNNTVYLNHNNKKLLATTTNNTIKLYDIESSKPILTFVLIDSIDYLVIDSSNRYDGTEAARKLLYFTCGNEIVGLDQVKDQLWVPNLAQRVNNGETINAKTLNELGICGLTPVVEQNKGLATEYFFKIKPRKGGLGETVVSFNGTPTLSIQPSQLKKTGAYYELRLQKDELKGNFIEGQENKIGIRAYTADNSSSSQPIIIIEDPDKEKRLPPNLYGVMIGVNDYKGDNIDLEYAAVDANDMSKVVGDAAKKLLGPDHVFMYNLTTEKERYLLPEKKAIESVFREIGKKAAANDILFIFLSGHGVISEKDKQYYYLTADASSTADESSFASVGISTAELTEWIKPQNIKAQKRILIYDACYSGQAINSLVKVGNERQGFLAARGDEKSQQLRAIDKLNEKSGLFILSASSSNQKAWESGIYSHGYLTYSLLKAIKLQPDILREGKYLDVARWLDAAGESVSEMAKADGSKQQPQIVSSTNFSIGVVDEEITDKIKLDETKAVFTSGNFLNSAIADDDRDLRKLIDKKLETLSRNEAGKKIIFLPLTNAVDAWSLTGNYAVKENSISMKVNLKQNKMIKYQFDIPGTTDKLEQLADAVIAKALEWIDANK